MIKYQSFVLFFPRRVTVHRYFLRFFYCWLFLLILYTFICLNYLFHQNIYFLHMLWFFMPTEAGKWTLIGRKCENSSLPDRLFKCYKSIVMSLLVAAKFDVNLCILIGIYLQYLMLEGILHFDAWHFISMGMDVVVSV